MSLLRGTLFTLLGLVGIALVSWPLYFRTPPETRGVWQTDGYGMVVEIGPWQVTGYQRTGVSCLPFFSAPNHRIALELAGGVSVLPGDGGLTILVDGNVNPITASRLPAMPDTCAAGGIPDPADTAAIAETFWHAMEENYPFFDLHGVNWVARGAVLRSLVEGSVSDGALWDALTASLDGLDDRHVYLADPASGLVFSPAIGPDWAAEVLDFREVPRSNTLAGIADTGLEFTILPGNIGYVFLRHMGVNPGLGTSEAEMAAIGFARVAQALAGTDAIILDNRLNPGGSDSVALTYAGFFTDVPLPAFTKVTRTADGFTPPFQAETPGIGGLDGKPVVLLNSAVTVSAAEIFTLALSEMPQVTVMGDATSGAFSDILEFNLPNGWVLGLSHQVYRDMAGNEWEGVGVPPDIALPFDEAAFRRGEDPQLGAAMARLQDR